MEVNPMAMLELTVDGSEEEKESDSDIEFIDEVAVEKELGLWVETEEAVANITIAENNSNGQVAKAPSEGTEQTTLEPQVQEVFNFPQVPLFDLTEEQQPMSINVEGDELLTKKRRIITTNEERNFRRSFFKENPNIGKFRLHCTICDVHLGTCRINSNRVKLHYCLRVLVCSKCYKPKLVDNTKSTTCNWCYTQIDKYGDRYIRCTKCIAVFCQICVERNLGSDVCKEIESSPAWECFICQPQQIWPHRVIACGLLKYFQKFKLMDQQQQAQDDLYVDSTDCCKDRQPELQVNTVNMQPSPHILAKGRPKPAVSQVGIEVPRFKSPPPLLPFPPSQDTLINGHNFQSYRIIDKNNERGGQVFFQGMTAPVSSNSNPQPQKAVFLQTNNGTIQIDTNAMKQMFLPGNQSVTLNTGPQVIHNVFPNRRVVLVSPNEEQKRKLLSATKTTPQHYTIPEELMPLFQSRNVSNNNEANRIHVQNPQTVDNTQKIRILHSGTLKGGSMFQFSSNNGKQTETSQTFETENPARVHSGSTAVQNEQAPRRNFTLSSLLYGDHPRVHRNTVAPSHVPPPLKVRVAQFPSILRRDISGGAVNCRTTPANIPPNVNKPSTDTTNQSSSILETVLTEGKEVDPLAVNAQMDEDDIIIVENDSAPLEEINFVDVQSDAVKDSITNVSGPKDLNQGGKEQSQLPSKPIIKIKSIEELVGKNVKKTILEETRNNHSEAQKKEMDTADESLVDMKLLKQAIDGVQRVLVSVIKSIRVNRATIKSYENLKCEPSLATKYISSIQDDLKMCTRQINVIQSNIYEYYKGVPGVVEPSTVEKNVSPAKRNVSLAKRRKVAVENDLPERVKKDESPAPVESNDTIVCIDDLDVTTDKNTENNQSITNYFDNFTKFLSSYNGSKLTKEPASKYAISRSRKPNDLSRQNDSENLNVNVNAKFKSKAERPKLDFDLKDKKGISGSPIVTEDDLKSQNSKQFSYSCEMSPRSGKNKVSIKITRGNKNNDLFKKYKLKKCSILLHRLDPELVKLHDSL